MKLNIYKSDRHFKEIVQSSKKLFSYTDRPRAMSGGQVSQGSGVRDVRGAIDLKLQAFPPRPLRAPFTSWSLTAWTISTMGCGRVWTVLPVDSARQ